MAVDACCCEVVCNPCPPGTIFPWAVDVTFTSIGVTVPAGNELDPEEDGETTFLYRVEGSYDGYSFQCTFGECDVNISIIRESDGVLICLASGTVAMTNSSCPPGALVLIYTIVCSSGALISVVISG
jgi:hypothetical protein